MVGPPKVPHLPGLRQIGLDDRHLVWIQADAPAERLWVTEQLIKGNAAGVLVAWLPQARQEQIRRLQICSQACEGPVFLCRPAAAEHEPSAAPLRLTLRFALDWALHIRLVKRRGPVHEDVIELPSVPGGLESILTPRLRSPSALIAERNGGRIDAAIRPLPMPPMLWAALLLDPSSRDEPRRIEAATSGLSIWCLQFTPRVAVIEPLTLSAAVVMDVAASTRLFGGKRRLAERVRTESAELGVAQLSWAPNSLAAVALARSGLSNGFGAPLAQLLDRLPIASLIAVDTHRATLLRLGCQTLGDVRALPRGGLSRRFDGALLAALDQAYGLRPEAHVWVQIPETFAAKLELMARVELAPALLFGARRLLLQMSAWLSARHSGVTAFTLRWCHDAMRSKTAGDGGEMTVRTAEPTRDLEHLTRLLAEHLGKVELLAPVGDLELVAAEVHPLQETSLALIPDVRQAGEGLPLVLERIAARLGAERVLRPVVLEDHRPEWMCHWRPAPEVVASRKKGRAVDIPQPTFVLPGPLRLACQAERPLYQGALQLLAGPHRVEGGWWDRTRIDGAEATRHVARDYWVALSEHAGVLWIFQTRLADEATAWFLHGVFA